jgi:hypothetical protein
MRLGLQQPYFFPYLGYYRLLFGVDRFVAYDDVAWIKGGWIHRNRLLTQHRPAWFTIPTRGASSHVALDSVKAAEGSWREKMLQTFEQSYARAPFRDPVLTMMRSVVATPSPFVADIAVASLEAVRDYLGFTTPIYRARNRYQQSAARAQDRVIAICRAEGATEYLNAIGGSVLYDRQAFENAGIALRFVRGASLERIGGDDRCEPALSILDTLMHNSIEQVRTLVAAYELV